MVKSILLKKRCQILSDRDDIIKVTKIKVDRLSWKLVQVSFWWRWTRWWCQFRFKKGDKVLSDRDDIIKVTKMKFDRLSWKLVQVWFCFDRDDVRDSLKEGTGCKMVHSSNAVYRIQKGTIFWKEGTGYKRVQFSKRGYKRVHFSKGYRVQRVHSSKAG